MKIYGLDFTSAPDDRESSAKKVKRLMLAVAEFQRGELHFREFRLLNRRKRDFSGFEEWLDTDGPWIAGLDFPFDQPAQLIDDLNWPGSWDAYVGHIAELGKQQFEQTLKEYKASKPAGQKHLFREIDRLTSSQSPMTLAGTPVGKMFFEGATRLRERDLSVVGLRSSSQSTRVVVEAYPALVAQKWVGRRQGYKNDDPNKSNENMTDIRSQIVAAFTGASGVSESRSCRDWYGFRVRLDHEMSQQCIDDFTGDSLDSVLCAVQAAWAFTKRIQNYGVPQHANPREGWICDPETAVDH